MGRRRKNKVRKVDGILLLDKPTGICSKQALQQGKHRFLASKSGHTGNLEPLATGMLPFCLGEATKALGVLLYGPKEYHALGRVHSLPSKEKLKEVVEMFQGEIF